MRSNSKLAAFFLAVLLCVLTGCSAIEPFDSVSDWLRLSGWHQSQDGAYKYMDKLGRPMTGWVDIDTSRYYFDPDNDGAMVCGWLDDGGERYYLDTDGKLYTGWLELNDTRYYLSEDGHMVTGWLTLEDDNYYLLADGTLATGWVELDGKRYFLDSNGIRQTGWLETDEGRCYLGEDGIMLTGWVQQSGDGWEEAYDTYSVNAPIYYCDYDGARLNGEWIKTYAPAVEPDDADEDEKKWYYIKSSGKPAVGKQSDINGQTYFFNERGEMLTGWVAGSGDDYEEIWEEDGGGTDLREAAANGLDVYFCGSRDDGHAKKNKWYKEWSSVEYGEDDHDNEKHWYYIQKGGKVFVPATSANATPSAIERLELLDVERNGNQRFQQIDSCKAMEKKINGETYLFDLDGQMIHGFVKKGQDMYYFGGKEDGTRKEGTVMVTDDEGRRVRCYFADETDETQGYRTGVGVNGAANGKLYEDGVPVMAREDRYEIREVSGMKFVVDANGTICSSKKPYKDGSRVLFGGAVFTYQTDQKGVSYESIATP